MSRSSGVHQALDPAGELLIKVIVYQLGLLIYGSHNYLLVLEDMHLLRSMVCYA